MGAPQIHTQQYYDTIYSLEEKHWWHRGMRSIARSLLASLPASERARAILDVGCGTGGMLDWILDLYPSSEVYGLDLAPEALTHCKQRGLSGLAIATACSLPFKPELFDLILCFDVLQHLPRPGGDLNALREMRKSLRPGGALLVRTNARRVGDPVEGMDHDFQRYELNQLQQITEAAGFEVSRITYANVCDRLREELRLKHRVQRTTSDHFEDQGLPLRLLPLYLRWIGEILRLFLLAEAFYLRSPGRKLGKGHSLWMLAIRPA